MSLLRVFKMIAIVFFVCSTKSYAQNSSAAGGSEQVTPKNQPIKKQVINFEDELIEGSSQKPELFYLLQKKNFNYKRLIRLRENFLPEMRRSSEDIKRLRGGR